MTTLLIILILVFVLFLFLNYLKFSKFIMSNNEREKFFSDEMMKQYTEYINNKISSDDVEFKDAKNDFEEF